MKKKLGIITIGQTPRIDMTEEMKDFFTNNVQFVEKGVLDGMTENEIALLAPTKEDQLLVSRLQDGSEVRLSKEKILPIVQDRIDELNDEGAHLILIACTGRFPIFTSKVEIIYPDFLLSHVVIGTFMNGTIGVIIPNENQKEMIENKWNKDGFAIRSEE